MISSEDHEVIIVGHKSENWLLAYKRLIEQISANSERRVLLIDVSSFITPSDPRKIEHKSLPSSSVQYWVLPFCSGTGPISEEISTGLKSQMHSLLKVENSPQSVNISLLRRSLGRTAVGLKESLVELFKKKQVSMVYIPNGRLSHWKAVESACQALELPITFFEIGWGHRLITTKSAPHQLDKFSDELKRVSPNVSSLIEAEEWLKRRISLSSGDNKYSSNFRIESGAYDAVFFSSSQDEYEALGEEWSFGWENQFQAFEDLINHLGAPEYQKIAVRLHPNTSGKPLRQQLAVRRALEKLVSNAPQVDVISPLSNVNSYKLVEQSKIVITNGSTIGLEALFLGKRVITTSPSTWSKVLEVTEWKPGQASLILPKAGRSRDAKLYVAKFKTFPFAGEANSSISLAFRVQDLRMWINFRHLIYAIVWCTTHISTLLGGLVGRSLWKTSKMVPKF